MREANLTWEYQGEPEGEDNIGAEFIWLMEVENLGMKGELERKSRRG